jgi:hypothetical protein
MADNKRKHEGEIVEVKRQKFSDTFSKFKYLDNFPPEILSEILLFASYKDSKTLKSACLTCKSFFNVLNVESSWKKVFPDGNLTSSNLLKQIHALFEICDASKDTKINSIFTLSNTQKQLMSSCLTYIFEIGGDVKVDILNNQKIWKVFAMDTAKISVLEITVKCQHWINRMEKNFCIDLDICKSLSQMLSYSTDVFMMKVFDQQLEAKASLFGNTLIQNYTFMDDNWGSNYDFKSQSLELYKAPAVKISLKKEDVDMLYDFYRHTHSTTLSISGHEGYAEFYCKNVNVESKICIGTQILTILKTEQIKFITKYMKKIFKLLKKILELEKSPVQIMLYVKLGEPLRIDLTSENLELKFLLCDVSDDVGPTEVFVPDENGDNDENDNDNDDKDNDNGEDEIIDDGDDEIVVTDVE